MKTKTKGYTKGLIAVVIILAMLCASVFMLSTKKANAEDAGPQVITETFSIKNTGVAPMTKVVGVSTPQGSAPNISEFKTDGEFVEKTTAEVSAPTYYVDYYHIVSSGNAIIIDTPIADAINVIEEASLRIYAHLADPNTNYRADGGQRGIWLYSLDTTTSTAGDGVIIPAKVTQDSWYDFTLSVSQMASLCDADGVFRGIRIASWIRSGKDTGTDGNGHIYWDNSGFFAIDSISYTEAPETVETMTNISIAAYPTGTTAMTKVLDRTGAVGSGDNTSLFESAAIAASTVAGASAASFGIHYYNIVQSSNVVLLNNPIENAAGDLSNLKLRIYAHLSAPNTSYRATYDRGIWLYSLDTTESKVGKSGQTGGVVGNGYLIPAKVMQDKWIDITLTPEEIAVLCDADGVFRGVRIASWIRSGRDTGTDGNGHIYADNSGYLAIGDILYTEKTAQDALTVADVTDAKYGDIIELDINGGSGNGAVTYSITEGDNIVTTEGRTLTFTGAGTVKVKAEKAADNDYKKAVSNEITITVAKNATNEIVWEEDKTPADMPYSGDAVDFAATAKFGTVIYNYFAWDNNANDWGSEALDNVPSARGKYKVVATVEDTANYNGDTDTVEFYITAAITVDGVSYEGSTKLGSTLTFTAINVPTGQEVDYFTVNDDPIVGNTYVMGNEDIAVGVVFKVLTYTITKNNNVTVSGTAQYGQTITLTAPTAPTGKAFDYFTVDSVKISGNTFVMPASDVTVDVVFKTVTYTVTKGDGVTVTGTAQYGQTITLTAGTAPEGKEFDYFTVDGEKISGNTFVMPASDVAVAVVWKDVVKEEDGGCKSSAIGGVGIVTVLLLAFAAVVVLKKRKNQV